MYETIGWIVSKSNAIVCTECVWEEEKPEGFPIKSCDEYEEPPVCDSCGKTLSG